MGVQITDFTENIINTTKQRASIFLRLTCDNVVDEATPKTPKKLGNLSRDVLKSVTGLHGEIEWRKGYAEYQERGKRKDGSHKIRHYTTPGTGPHYAENAIDKIVGNKWAKIAKLSNLI